MRLLERRFFSKLDDKKTSTIDSIVTFLKDTHHELMTLIHSLEKEKDNLTKFVFFKQNLQILVCCFKATVFEPNLNLNQFYF